jgi:hypothetical protein
MNNFYAVLLAFLLFGILFGMLAAVVLPTGYKSLALVVTALTVMLAFTRS